jgi:hypothetical protein
MGEKAATNDVINRLLISLGDTDVLVRNSACEFLGKMGEKAASNEVINGLLLLLGDPDETVRSGACHALGKMGEKAATNEVINRLLLLLSDTNDSVRRSACQALGKMDEEVAISKVFGVLLDARCENAFGMKDIVVERTGKIFDSFPCLRNLEDIDKEENRHYDWNCWFMKNRSPEEFIRVFLHTKRSFWLPIIARLLIEKGYGITVTDNTVVVYGSKEPVELLFSDGELGQRLRNYFSNWLDKSLKR